jgi:HAMP domain-containing protein
VFNLGVPHKGTVALVAMGLAIALVIAAAAMRWRGDEQAATDTVS